MIDLVKENSLTLSTVQQIRQQPLSNFCFKKKLTKVDGIGEYLKSKVTSVLENFAQINCFHNLLCE